MLANVLKDHDVDELDCVSCEEQFGMCSCGGTIHAEYQSTFEPKLDSKGKRIVRNGRYIPVPTTVLTLECDRCDEYEVQ